MDREYVKGLSLDEALAIIDNCIKELHTRFLIAQKNFVIKVCLIVQQYCWRYLGCVASSLVCCESLSFVHMVRYAVTHSALGLDALVEASLPVGLCDAW